MEQDNLSQSFGAVWNELMGTPIHLDSLLSKQKPRAKSILAQVLPPILLRPISLAESLGVGVLHGQPWSLSIEAIKSWPAAAQMALELHSRLQHRGIPEPRVLAEDFPPHFREAVTREWGEETAQKLFASLSRPAPLSLRLSRRIHREELLKAWKKEGKIPVKMELSSLSPLGLCFKEFTPILHTPEYERGEYEIQDEGSQLMSIFALWPERVAPLLSETPGGEPRGLDPVVIPEGKAPVLKVVDACAGAGGKSLAMADLMSGLGRVFSYDISLPKLNALRRRARHAGLNNIQAVQVVDGREHESFAKFEKSADRVLVDAPCSGWGVLRRNPDIKWRQSMQSLERFPAFQLRLLESYSSLAAPGGFLTYGTCTFRRAETTEIVEKFMERNGDRFILGHGGFVGPGSSDGFFMQSFVRKA